MSRTVGLLIKREDKPKENKKTDKPKENKKTDKPKEKSE